MSCNDLYPNKNIFLNKKAVPDKLFLKHIIRYCQILWIDKFTFFGILTIILLSPPALHTEISYPPTSRII